MKPIRLIMCAIAACIAIAGRSQIHIKLGAPEQVLSGWGITLADLDWDGAPTLHDMRATESLLRDYGFTHLRIILGKSVYDDVKDDGSLNENALEADVVDQVRLATEAKGIRYIISVINAPKIMKLYYAEAAFPDGMQNMLRPEREHDFAGYLVAILDRLRMRHLQMPQALALEMQPYIQGHWLGCVYSAEQWIRVMRLLRHALDMHGYAEIGLIGPVADLATTIQVSRELSVADYSLLAKGGIGYHWHFGTRESDTANAQCSNLLGASDTQPAIWMTGSRYVEAIDDRSLLPEVFAELADDLNVRKTNYWFWDCGYAREPNASALISDAHPISAIGRAMAMILKTIPQGSHVRQSVIASASIQHPAFHVVAFEVNHAAVLVCTNVAAQPSEVFVTGVPTAFASGISFIGAEQHRVQVTSRERALHFVVPGNSVVLIK